MKHQQVSVDYWAMAKTMFSYAIMAAMGWLMLRMFNTVFMLPRRLRSHQDTIQNTLAELQKRFPDLNITEEDLKEAEKELEEYMKEKEDEGTKTEKVEEGTGEVQAKLEEDKTLSVAGQQPDEDKKTI